MATALSGCTGMSVRRWCDGCRPRPGRPRNAGFSIGCVSVPSPTTTAKQELGLGYSFGANAFLASGAVQTSHASLGTDLIFGKLQWLPYVGLDTLSRPHALSDGSLGCSSGTLTSATVLNNSIVTVLPGQQVNGLTCFTNNLVVLN